MGRARTEAPAPQPASGGWHFAEWTAELIGTAILVFAILLAVVLVLRPSSALAGWPRSTRLLLVGVAIGTVIAAIAMSPIGRRSGAHINPAVTLAFRLTGHVHPHDLGGYWAAQLAGGVLGAGAFRLLWMSEAASVHFGVLHPGITALQAAGLEAAMTAALVLTLFAFLSVPSLAHWAPVAAGAVVAVAIWLAAPATGTGMNPARTLGPNVIAGDYGFWWVYVVGPVAGALFAGGVWRLVPRIVLTAKLYHDERYPSVLRTHLPALPPRHGW